MPKIYVAKAFTLTHDDGTRTSFDVGNHKVDQEIADHWFVKHHLGEAPAQEGADTSEQAKQRLAELERLAIQLDDERKRLEELSVALDARADELDKREAELDKRETALKEAEAKATAQVDAKAAAKPTGK